MHLLLPNLNFEHYTVSPKVSFLLSVVLDWHLLMSPTSVSCGSPAYSGWLQQSTLKLTSFQGSITVILYALFFSLSVMSSCQNFMGCNYHDEVMFENRAMLVLLMSFTLRDSLLCQPAQIIFLFCRLGHIINVCIGWVRLMLHAML